MRNDTVRSQEAWPGSGSGEEDPAEALLVWTPALEERRRYKIKRTVIRRVWVIE